MKKRITAALLALCLVLPLAACGQAAEPELDIDAFGEELYAAGKFGETLYALDEAVAQGLYGTGYDTRCWVRAGTGATAEELAGFQEAASSCWSQAEELMGSERYDALMAALGK